MKKQYVMSVKTHKLYVCKTDRDAFLAKNEGKYIAVSAPPSLATMEKWMDSGVARAVDGCRVEPDGVCPHGCQSWILVQGLI